MSMKYYEPPEPINKPEKTLKLRYVGESFYVEGLTNGKIYEAWEEDEDYYRVIDDSGEDYLYSKINPGPLDGSNAGGIWVEAGEDEWKAQAR